MKKFLLFIFLLTASLLQAQELLHHEMALDAAPLLRSSTSNLTVMYRYYFNNLVFRSQAMISLNNVSNDMVNESNTPGGVSGSSGTDAITNNFQTQLRIGLQRNISFDKWVAYGGMDLLYNHSTTESSYETLNPGSYGSSRNKGTTESSSTGYGAAPVLGVSYKLHHRILVSLENSFTFLYSQNSSRQKTEYYFTPVQGVEGLNSTSTYSTSGSSTTFDFSPSKYMRLFVAFRF